MKPIRTCNLITFFILLSLKIFSQNHSFSYVSPQCTNGTNPNPIPSANFVPGGNYSSTAGLNINSSSGVITLASSSPGTYTVSYSCTCFTNPPVFATISIVAPPVVSISGPSQVCLGSAISLTASGANSYSWSTGPFGPVMTDVPGVNTTYTVYATSGSGCVSQAIKSITVNPIPSVNIVANSTLCSGYAYSITAIGSQPMSYFWSPTGHTSSGFSIVPTSNMTFSVTGTTSGGCTTTAVHQLNILPLPNVTIAPPTTTLCFGSVMTLTASGAISYSWNTGSPDDTLQVSPLSSTNYTVYGTDFNGCVKSAVKSISVVPRPAITTLGNTSVCSGKSLVKTAIGGVTYTWSTGATGSTVSLSPTNDTVYTVSGSNIHGCIGTSSVFINVNISPTITSIKSTSMCAGNSATIETTALPEDAINYQWFPGPSQNSGTITVSPANTTNYTVVASIGQCTHSAVKQVFVLKLVLNFTYETPVCTGDSKALPKLATNFTKGGVFSSDVAMPLNPVTGQIDLNAIAPGFYPIRYTYEGEGCLVNNISNASIFVNQSIKINAEPNVAILPGEPVTLTHSGGADYYNWTPDLWMDCSSCPNPVVRPMSSIKYCVSSGQACVIGTCIDVEVLCVNHGDLSVPNAFTPNRDGKNEKFCLQGWSDCNHSFTINIFDRWGGLVYESKDPNFCWDGTSDGQPLLSGVYMYVITAKFSKDPKFTKSGNITLIR